MNFLTISVIERGFIEFSESKSDTTLTPRKSNHRSTIPIFKTRSDVHFCWRGDEDRTSTRLHVSLINLITIRIIDLIRLKNYRYTIKKFYNTSFKYTNSQSKWRYRLKTKKSILIVRCPSFISSLSKTMIHTETPTTSSNSHLGLVPRMTNPISYLNQIYIYTTLYILFHHPFFPTEND